MAMGTMALCNLGITHTQVRLFGTYMEYMQATPTTTHTTEIRHCHEGKGKGKKRTDGRTDGCLFRVDFSRLVDRATLTHFFTPNMSVFPVPVSTIIISQYHGLQQQNGQRPEFPHRNAITSKMLYEEKSSNNQHL